MNPTSTEPMPSLPRTGKARPAGPSSEHYGVAVIPARVRKPKDKAKVEVGVQVVEQQILAPLRHRTFFSLKDANAALKALLLQLNDKPFQKQTGSRKSLFDEVEKAVLRPLPLEAYVLANWKKATVHVDYHVHLDGHYYSVPYQYVGASVELRFTQHTLEVFEGQAYRLASSSHNAERKGGHTTLKEHMPERHKFRGEWTPERFVHWAQKTGEHTAQVVEAILRSRPHPEQGFRACLGVMRLAKTYGEERLEAACKRACYLQSYSYKSVESILKHNLDQEPLPEAKPEKLATQQPHHNLRGAAYYRKELN